MDSQSKSSEGIRVAIRMRPLNEREVNSGQEKVFKCQTQYNAVTQIKDGQAVDGGTSYFDKVFDESARNTDVYDYVGKEIVQGVMGGINGTVFAYGQTSSGKTHTMLGGGDEKGVLNLAAEAIFRSIANTPTRDFLLRASFLEIYNENLRDLLGENPDGTVQIREDPRRGVYCEATEVVITDFDSIVKLLKKGISRRVVEATAMNDTSSRSHSIFKLVVESRESARPGYEPDGAVLVSALSLVDLAGSESVRHTGARGERAKEGGKINQSLLSLSRVIHSLSIAGAHVNFRDSKLTRLLQPSLSGNARMAIVCCITSASSYVEETRSTLSFASRAKLVVTNAKVNEVLDESSQIRRLKRELEEMKDEKTKLEEEVERLKGGVSQAAPATTEPAAALTPALAPLAELPPMQTRGRSKRKRQTWGGEGSEEKGGENVEPLSVTLPPTPSPSNEEVQHWVVKGGELEKENRELKLTIEAWKEKEESWSKDKKTLEGEKGALGSEVRLLKEEVTSLTERCTQDEGQFTEMIFTMGEIEEQLSNAKGLVDSLLSVLGMELADVVDIPVAVEALKEKVEQLEKDAKSFAVERTKYEDLLQEEKEKEAEMESALCEAKAQLQMHTSAQDELQVVSQRAMRLAEQVHAHQQEVLTLRSLLTQNDIEVESFMEGEKESLRIRNNLEGKVEDLKRENAELKESVTTMAKQVQEREDEFSSMRMQLDTLSEQLTIQQDCVAKLEADKDAVAQQLLMAEENFVAQLRSADLKLQDVTSSHADKVNKLESEISTLQEQIDSMSSFQSVNLTRMSELEVTTKEIDMARREMEIKSEQWREQLMMRESEVSRLMQENDEFKSELKAVQEALASNSSQSQSLSDMEGQLRKKVSQVVTENDLLKSEKESLQLKLKSTEQQIKSIQHNLELKNEQLEQKVAMLTNDLSSSREDKAKLERMSESIKSLERGLAAAGEELKLVQQERDMIAMELTQLKRDHEDVLGAHETLKKEKGEAEGLADRIRQLTDDNDQLQVRVRKMKEEKERMEVEVETFAVERQQTADAMEKLNFNLQESSSQRDEALSLVEELKMEVESLVSSSLDAEHLESLRSQVSSLTEERNTLTVALEHVNTQLEEKDVAINALEQNISLLSEDKEGALMIAEQLKKDLNQLTEEHDTTMSMLQQLQTQVDSLTQERDAALATMEQLALQVEEKDEIIITVQRLQQLVDSLQQEKSESTERLQHMVSSLTEERDTAASSIADLQQKIEVLTQERDEAVDSFEQLTLKSQDEEEAVAAIALLQQQISSLTQEAENATVAIQGFQQMVDVLSQEKDAANAVIQQLEQKVSSLAVDRDEALGGLQQLASQLQDKEEATSAVQALQERMDLLTQERDSAQAALEQLQLQYQKVEQFEHSEMDSLKQQNAESLEKISQLEEKVQLLTEERDSLTATLEQLTFQVQDKDEIASSMTLLQQQFDALSSEKDEAVTGLASLQQEMDVLTQQRDDAVAKLETLAGQEQVQSENNAVVSQLEQQISSLTQERDEVVFALEQLNEQMSAVVQERDSAATELEVAAERLEQLTAALEEVDNDADKVAALEEERDALNGQVAELESVLIDTQSKLAVMEDQRSSLLDEITSLEGSVSSHEAAMQEKDACIAALSEKVSTLEAVVEEKTLFAASQEERVASLEDRICNYDKRASEEQKLFLEAAEMQMDKLKLQIETMEKEQERQSEIRSKFDREEASLLIQIDKLTTSLEASEESLKELKVSLDRKEAELTDLHKLVGEKDARIADLEAKKLTKDQLEKIRTVKEERKKYMEGYKQMKKQLAMLKAAYDDLKDKHTKGDSAPSNEFLLSDLKFQLAEVNGDRERLKDMHNLLKEKLTQCCEQLKVYEEEREKILAVLEREGVDTDLLSLSILEESVESDGGEGRPLGRDLAEAIFTLLDRIRANEQKHRESADTADDNNAFIQQLALENAELSAQKASLDKGLEKLKNDNALLQLQLEDLKVKVKESGVAGGAAAAAGGVEVQMLEEENLELLKENKQLRMELSKVKTTGGGVVNATSSLPVTSNEAPASIVGVKRTFGREIDPNAAPAAPAAESKKKTPMKTMPADKGAGAVKKIKVGGGAGEAEGESAPECTQS